MNADAIVEAAAQLREEQQDRMLLWLRECPPSRFEEIVVELCVRLGLAKHGEVTGRTSDGGIDGALYEDRIGLGVIYLQAKRWNRPVGRPEIQQFAGALTGRGVGRGIFLTTSRFTKQAIEYAEDLSIRISLIDGLDLVELMYDYDLGFSIAKSIDIKGLDEDIFTVSWDDYRTKGQH